MLKSLPVLSALVFSSAAFSIDLMDLLSNTQKFELKSVAKSSITESMILPQVTSEIPARLKGLWWLDGNPIVTSILMTFGKGEWDAKARTLTMPVYEEGIWAWEASEEGQLTYELVLKSQLVYTLQLNEDLTEGVVIPNFKIAGFTVQIPTRLLKISLSFVDDGYWLRDTYVFGKKVHVYDFRRIVRSDGQREEAFEDFLASVPDQLAVAQRLN